MNQQSLPLSKMGQKKHLLQDQPNFSNSFTLVTKIFDGFFVGNHEACTEEQFLYNNKITLIINCSPDELILRKKENIQILEYMWQKNSGQLKSKVNVNLMMQIMIKIQCVMENKCEGVLITSKNCDTRCIAMCLVYLMIKYSWEISMCLQFIQSKKTDLQVKLPYIKLLSKFDSNSERSKISEIFDSKQNKAYQQMLKNTFINSKVQNMPNFYGLDFKKIEQKNQQINHSNLSIQKKVSFSSQILIINYNQRSIVSSKPEKEIEQSEPKHNSIKEKKVVEDRLKQFIINKLNSQNIFDNQQTRYAKKGNNQVNQIYQNKEKTQFNPRKRALSKTEQSQTNDKTIILEKTKKICQNNYFLGSNDNKKNSQKSISLHIPSLEVKMNQNGSQQFKKDYIISSNNKGKIKNKTQDYIKNFNKRSKHKLKERIITEISQDNYFCLNEPNQSSRKNEGNIFKITKAKANQNLMRRTPSPMINQNHKQQSIQIKFNEESQYLILDESFERNNYSKQKQLSRQKQVIVSKKQMHKGNIYNVNLNFQIQNMNFIENYEQKKSIRKIYEDKKKIKEKYFYDKANKL